MHPLTKKMAGFGLGLFVIMAGGVARPAFADTKVSQVIIAGTRSASVTSHALAEVPAGPVAHSVRTQNGTVTLTADDPGGSGAGWNVTFRASDFVYSGANGGTDIPAANFSLTTISAPTVTAGEAVDVANGPMVPAGLSGGRTLDSSVKVLQANPDCGMGTYTQVIDTRPVVPALSRAGTPGGSRPPACRTRPRWPRPGPPSPRRRASGREREVGREQG